MKCVLVPKYKTPCRGLSKFKKIDEAFTYTYNLYNNIDYNDDDDDENDSNKKIKIIAIN